MAGCILGGHSATSPPHQNFVCYIPNIANHYKKYYFDLAVASNSELEIETLVLSFAVTLYAAISAAISVHGLPFRSLSASSLYQLG